MNQLLYKSNMTSKDYIGKHARDLLNVCCTLCDEAKGSRDFLKAVFGFDLSRVIVDTPIALVVPSLGQIVEGYLLAFPKKHVSSWASLQDDEFSSFEEVVLSAERLVESRFGHSTVFEHGMGGCDARGGCGVTHAHIHVVPGNFKLQRATVELQLQRISKYTDIKLMRDNNYVLIKNNEGILISQVKELESQFIRKILAEETGRPELWDWQEYVGREEVLKTIRKYSLMLWDTGREINKIDDPYVEKFIEMAELVAERGTCGIRKVGAVVVVNGIPVVVGWNGAPDNLPSCNEIGHAWRDGHCVRSLHAEAMCVARATRYGISIASGDIFVTAYPCYTCFKLLASAGVRRIFFYPYTVDPMVEESSKALGIELIMVSD